jgi:hypothetical protein
MSEHERLKNDSSDYIASSVDLGLARLYTCASIAGMNSATSAVQANSRTTSTTSLHHAVIAIQLIGMSRCAPCRLSPTSVLSDKQNHNPSFTKTEDRLAAKHQ